MSTINNLTLNVKQVRDYALIKGNLFVSHLKKFNLSTLVDEVTTYVENQAAIKGLTILTDYQGFQLKENNNNQGARSVVPLEDINLTVECDEERLKQVLVQIAQDAIKFTTDGSQISIQFKMIQPMKESSEVDSHQSIINNNYLLSSDIEELYMPDYKYPKLVISVTDESKDLQK